MATDMPPYDLVTLGETMIRLTPPTRSRLEEASRLELRVGGAESNVAAGLAHLGKRAAWLSALPASPLGRRVASDLAGHGVDLSLVSWSDDARLGIYFVEVGAAPRPTRVFYDRRGSAASALVLSDAMRAAIGGARRLHLSGITPALSDACLRAAEEARDLAGRHGVPLSFDVNYRALLWSPADAARTLEPFCRAADLVVIAHRDAVALFGASERRHEAVGELQRRWGGRLVISGGEEGASAAEGDEIVEASAFPTEIVDRFGAGDALTAGILCRLLEGASLAQALRFGVALAALKLTIPGDVVTVTRAEVDALLASTPVALHR